MKIKIKKLHEDAIVPKYQTNGASGFDLHSLEDFVIKPGETKLVKTGLAISVGSGYELQVRARSGLSLKTSLRIANGIGTVDSDYLGDVSVIAWNCASYEDGVNSDVIIKKGDRIAQGVICPVIQADIEVVEYLENTQRGSGGFGSTGK